MQIKTWSNFSKRVNSTKQPLDSSATTKDVTLKDMCDILAPSFILNTTDFDINYVQAFGNYYFAQCINLDGHRTEIKCSLDHLATFKSQIGSYNGLINYCSASSDVTITDPRNNPTDLITASATTFSLSGVTFNTVGGYVLGVLSDNVSGDVGVVDYYTMTSAQMRAFCQELYSQNFIQQLVDQAFYSAIDSFISCIWLPMTGIGGGSVPVHIGRETMTAQGGHIADRIVSFNSGLTTLNFSSNSGGAGSAMTYLEKAPYCTGILYLPFVGFVPIDMDVAAFTKSIALDGYIDILTGDIVYNVKYGAYRVSTYNGNVATKVPISAASYDAVGTATGAITSIGGVAASIFGGLAGKGASMVLGGLGAAVGGAASAVKSSELHTMINGGNSSAIGANLGTSPYALIIQNEPTETNLLAFQTKHGMPYFKVATVSSCGGFVQCADASVSIPGDGAEQDTVNSYLNAGIYYE